MRHLKRPVDPESKEAGYGLNLLAVRSDLVAISWSQSAISRLSAHIQHLRSRERRYRFLSATSQIIAGLIINAMLFVALLVSRTTGLINGLLLAGLVLLITVLVFGRRLRRWRRGYENDHRRAALYATILSATRLCYQIMDNPGASSYERATLARSLNSATYWFRILFKPPRFFSSSRLFRGQLTDRVKELSLCFVSHRDVALFGTATEIFAMRDTLLRALLRIEANDWLAVEPLLKEGYDRSDYLRPNLVDRVLSQGRAPLTVGLLTVLAAALTLAAKVMS